MAAPPLRGGRLRPPRRRILPGLLPPEGSEVEERPGAAEGLGASAGGEVGAEDVVALAHKNAEAEGFAAVAGDAEIDIEIAAGRGEPRHAPAHALLIRANVGERRPRHQDEGGI